MRGTCLPDLPAHNLFAATGMIRNSRSRTLLCIFHCSSRQSFVTVTVTNGSAVLRALRPRCSHGVATGQSVAPHSRRHRHAAGSDPVWGALHRNIGASTRCQHRAALSLSILLPAWRQSAHHQCSKVAPPPLVAAAAATGRQPRSSSTDTACSGDRGGPLVDPNLDPGSELDPRKGANAAVQLEALPLRWLPRAVGHRNSRGCHAASGGGCSSPGGGGDDDTHGSGGGGDGGGGGSANKGGGVRPGSPAIAYRHFLPSAQPLGWVPVGGGHDALSSGDGGARVPPPYDDVCVLYCNGLKSSMTGAKVRHALSVAAALGCEFVCFDYLGFGASAGPPFEACGLQDWIEDAQELMSRIVQAKTVVVVGSSLGGWVALRLAQLQASEAAAEPAAAAAEAAEALDSPKATSTSHTTTCGDLQGGQWRLRNVDQRLGLRPSSACEQDHALGPTIGGLLLVAPAVDFSEVRWARLTEADQWRLLTEADELVQLGSPYDLDGGDAVGVPYFQQGRLHLLHCPVGRSEPLRPGVAFLGVLAEVDAGVQVPVTPTQLAAQGPSSQEVPVAAQAPVSARPTPIAVPVSAPVVVLHGSKDEIVPLAHAEALCAAITAAVSVSKGRGDTGGGGGSSSDGFAISDDASLLAAGSGARAAAAAAAPARLEVLEDGDHRLSSAEGLAALGRWLGWLVSKAKARAAATAATEAPDSVEG